MGRGWKGRSCVHAHTYSQTHLRTCARPGRWSSKGTVYLSNIRLVFLAEKPDESGEGRDWACLATQHARSADAHPRMLAGIHALIQACLPLLSATDDIVFDTPHHPGLAGFDLPLVYITGDKLNQPIFGCNNLAGKVWPAVEGGGPAGTLPPHDWKVRGGEGDAAAGSGLIFYFMPLAPLLTHT